MIIRRGLRKMPRPQGAKSDTQCFYEQPALTDLVAHLELAGAEKVIEFGCGTGRLAEEVFFKKKNRYRPRFKQHDDRTRTESHSPV